MAGRSVEIGDDELSLAAALPGWLRTIKATMMLGPTIYGIEGLGDTGSTAESVTILPCPNEERDVPPSDHGIALIQR